MRTRERHAATRMLFNPEANRRPRTRSYLEPPIALPPEHELTTLRVDDETGRPFKWSWRDSAGIEWAFTRTPMGKVMRERLTPRPAPSFLTTPSQPDRQDVTIPATTPRPEFLDARHDLAALRLTDPGAIALHLARHHKALTQRERDDLRVIFAGISFPTED